MRRHEDIGCISLVELTVKKKKKKKDEQKMRKRRKSEISTEYTTLSNREMQIAPVLGYEILQQIMVLL